jgi:hypothetical protein
MNKIGKTLLTASRLWGCVYISNEVLQEFQQPGDTDRELTYVSERDTGYIQETIRQESAYRRPAQERLRLAQRRVSDTGDATDTGRRL